MGGFFCSFNQDFNDELIQSISKRLAHRGPIGQKTAHLGNIVVVSRFLRSPESEFFMRESSDQSFAIIDGDILNKKEICVNLNKEYKTETCSDAELILDGYLKWGDTFLRRVDGCFSFLLYDGERELLIGGRDKFGTKPLYYTKNGNKFAAASEIKALLKLNWLNTGPNIRNLRRFILYGEDYFGTETFFENIYTVPSATYFIFAINTSKLYLKRYWDPVKVYCKETYDLSSAIERYKELLMESIQQNFVKGKRKGISLSGGLDSTLLSTMCISMAKQLKDEENTFTISIVYPDVEENVNELPLIEKIASSLSVEHFYITPSPDYLIRNFE